MRVRVDQASAAHGGAARVGVDAREGQRARAALDERARAGVDAGEVSSPDRQRAAADHPPRARERGHRLPATAGEDEQSCGAHREVGAHRQGVVRVRAEPPFRDGGAPRVEVGAEQVQDARAALGEVARAEDRIGGRGAEEGDGGSREVAAGGVRELQIGVRHVVAEGELVDQAGSGGHRGAAEVLVGARQGERPGTAHGERAGAGDLASELPCVSQKATRRFQGGGAAGERVVAVQQPIVQKTVADGGATGVGVVPVEGEVSGTILGEGAAPRDVACELRVVGDDVCGDGAADRDVALETLIFGGIRVGGGEVELQGGAREDVAPPGSRGVDLDHAPLPDLGEPETVGRVRERERARARLVEGAVVTEELDRIGVGLVARDLEDESPPTVDGVRTAERRFVDVQEALVHGGGSGVALVASEEIHPAEPALDEGTGAEDVPGGGLGLIRFVAEFENAVGSVVPVREVVDQGSRVDVGAFAIGVLPLELDRPEAALRDGAVPPDQTGDVHDGLFGVHLEIERRDREQSGFQLDVVVHLQRRARGRDHDVVGATVGKVEQQGLPVAGPGLVVEEHGVHLQAVVDVVVAVSVVVEDGRAALARAEEEPGPDLVPLGRRDVPVRAEPLFAPRIGVAPRPIERARGGLGRGDGAGSGGDEREGEKADREATGRTAEDCHAGSIFVLRRVVKLIRGT